MDLRHVMVPKKYGGRGFAKILTEVLSIWIFYLLSNRFNWSNNELIDELELIKFFSIF